jgi:hypothetical protein
LTQKFNPLKLPIYRILLLANGWLCVVAGNVVEYDAVVVEVVEHGHAELVPFAVVGLSSRRVGAKMEMVSVTEDV